MSADAHDTKPTVGLIGLGNLGKPMALSLLDAGYQLVVNSLSKAEADDLVSRGATWVDTVAEIGAQSDVVITVLPGPTQVRDIMIGQRGEIGRAHV